MESTAALAPPSLHPRERVLSVTSVALTAVQDHLDVATVREPLSQVLVAIKTVAGHDEEQHAVHLSRPVETPMVRNLCAFDFRVNLTDSGISKSHSSWNSLISLVEPGRVMRRSLRALPREGG